MKLITKIAGMAILLGIDSPAARADVRLTTQVVVRPISTVARPSADAAPLPQGLATPGETKTYIAGGSVRIEQLAGTVRSVVLIRPDGQFVLFPDSQRYLRAAALGNASGSLAPTFIRTGEFSTLLGHRCERVLVQMSLALPVTPPAGFPTRVTFDGELWLADAYRSEGEALRKTLALVSSLPAGLEGMVMRQVFRNNQLGYEIESTVLDITDGPIAAEMFEIPAGFRSADQPAIPETPPAGARRAQP